MADSRPASINVAHSLCELTSHNCHCSFKVRKTYARLTFAYFAPSPCFFTSFGGEMIREGEKWQEWDEATGAASLLNPSLWSNCFKLVRLDGSISESFSLTQKFHIGQLGWIFASELKTGEWINQTHLNELCFSWLWFIESDSTPNWSNWSWSFDLSVSRVKRVWQEG